MEIDVNKPVTNPALVALLEEFNNVLSDKDRAFECYNKIAEELAMNAVLLAVFEMDPSAITPQGNGMAVFEKDSKISFPMLHAPDDTTYLPVYSDWNELRKNREYAEKEVKTLLLRFDDIAAITAGESGLVINPFSHNVVVTPQNIISFKQHKDQISGSRVLVPKGTEVKLGEPAVYPTEMINAISEYARKNKNIEALWLKLMEMNDERSLLIVVDCKGDYDRTIDGIADAGKPFLPRGMLINMTPASESFGKSVASGSKPFYKRKKGLFGF